MADINIPNNQGHGKTIGVKRSKKLSTRIDLTPMVDLGFLLITFFLYTTTMAKPKAMAISLPYESNHPSLWKDGQTMTILLSKEHRVYYYDGIGNNPIAPPDVKMTGFNSVNGIRQVIIDKIKRVKALQAKDILNTNNTAAFLIKPDVNSTYDDFVKIMDEMSINDVKINTVVNISPVDQELIVKAEVTGLSKVK